MPAINLLQLTRTEANRVLGLVIKARRLTPWWLTGAIVAFLFSQFFSILAFFLPLKAILLLAQEGVPWYLAGVATAETKDTLVLVMAGVAIGSYGLHLLCDKLEEKAVQAGSQQLLGRAKKLHLFKNQTDLARDGYRRLTELVGSAVIVGLGMLLGLYINTLLFAAFAALLVVEYGLVYWLLRSQTALGQTVREAFEWNLGRAVGLISTWNFLLGFVMLFLEFLAMEQRNIVIAILSIILILQLTQRIRQGVMGLAFVFRTSRRLNALFHAGVPYIEVEKPPSFLKPLSGRNRNRMLAAGLDDVLGQAMDLVESTWVDSDMPGVAYYEVTVPPGEDDEAQATGLGTDRKYFVKCYDKSRSLGAAHELQLFKGMRHGVPGAPGLVGDTFVDDTRVLVFDGLPDERVSRAEWNEIGVAALFNMWSVKPDNGLLRAYLRSHPTITRRLGTEQMSQMWLAVDDERDKVIVNRLIESWDGIRADVDEVPLVVDNPGMKSPFCRQNPDGSVCCFSWNRWRIEPLGCNDRFAGLDQEELQELFAMLDAQNIPVRASARQVLLVSRLFELESALQRTRFREAIDVAETVLDALAIDANADDTGYLGNTGT